MILAKLTGSREEQAAAFAIHLRGLYREDQGEVLISPYAGGRAAGLEALQTFEVQGYAKT